MLQSRGMTRRVGLRSSLDARSSVPLSPYVRCVDNFMRSCAGYCVATYVLGIGDRHPSNIMLTRSGKLFHIDFGHFLGNFKKKLGIKRERVPFVFTPAFARVLGYPHSQVFAKFEQLCCAAFNVLRHQAHLLLMLFALMFSCGMPELQTLEDVEWLRDHLLLGHTDEEAAAEFSRQLRVCIHTRATQVNDAFHMIKHF